MHVSTLVKSLTGSRPGGCGGDSPGLAVHDNAALPWHDTPLTSRLTHSSSRVELWDQRTLPGMDLSRR